MDPPYVKTIDKKLGRIYFSEKIKIFKPSILGDKTSFSFNDADIYQNACMKGKYELKANITALDESLVFKKKSSLGKKLPHKQIKYMFVNDFYEFSQAKTLIILALAIPNKPRNYLALDIADPVKMQLFIQILKYASVAPNRNIKNPIPRPSLTPKNTFVQNEMLKLQSTDSQNDPTTQNNIYEKSQPPSDSPTTIHSRKESKRSVSSSDRRISSSSSSTTLSSSSPSSLSLASLSNSRRDMLEKITDNHTNRSESGTAVEQSKISTICASTSSYVANSPQSSFCEKCKNGSKKFATRTTSPILFNNLQNVKQVSFRNPQSGFSSVTKYIHKPSNGSKIIPVRVVKNLNSRSSSSSSSSSSESIDRKNIKRKGNTLPNKDENVFFLASGKFEPFSYIRNEKNTGKSSCDVCSICGKMGEGESRRLDIIQTDRNGISTLSNEGTVFMYSKTEKQDSAQRIPEDKVISKSVFEKVLSSKKYREEGTRSENSSSSSDSSLNEYGITFLK